MSLCNVKIEVCDEDEEHCQAVHCSLPEWHVEEHQGVFRWTTVSE